MVSSHDDSGPPPGLGRSAFSAILNPCPDRVRPRPFRLPRLRSGGGRGADHRPRRGTHAQLVLSLCRRRRRRGRPGGHHRRAGPGADLAAAHRAAPRRRRPAAHLRAAVAAQGRAARLRAQGPARRGGHLRAGDRGRAAGRQTGLGLGRLLVRDRLQGRAPRGSRGRVHRAHLRRQPAPGRSGRRRGRPRRARRGGDRRRGSGAAGSGPREHDEVLRSASCSLRLGPSGAPRARVRRGRAATPSLLAIVPAVALVAIGMVRWLRSRPSAARLVGEPA